MLIVPVAITITIAITIAIAIAFRFAIAVAVAVRQLNSFQRLHPVTEGTILWQRPERRCKFRVLGSPLRQQGVQR